MKIKKQFEIDQNIEDLVVQEVDIENKIIFIAEFDDFEQSDDSVQNNVEINNEPVSEKMQIPDDIIKNIVDNDKSKPI